MKSRTHLSMAPVVALATLALAATVHFTIPVDGPVDGSADRAGLRDVTRGAGPASVETPARNAGGQNLERRGITIRQAPLPTEGRAVANDTAAVGSGTADGGPTAADPVPAAEDYSDRASTRSTPGPAPDAAATDPKTESSRLSAKAAALARSGSQEMVDVIVVYGGQAAAAEAEAEADRILALGGEHQRGFDRVGMRSMRVPADRLSELSTGQGIRVVAVDEPLVAASASARATGRVPVKGSPAYVPVDETIGIAVLDSGVGTHPDLNLKSQVHIIPPATRAENPGRAEGSLQALYVFDEGLGETLFDRIPGDGSLPLTLENPGRVSWLETSLRIDAPTRLSNPDDNNRIYESCTASNALTVEAWITPALTSQGGPARIVTLSRDPGNRNFTLGQNGDRYQFRLRTTTNGNNGLNTVLSSAPGSVSTSLQHVVAVRDSAGQARMFINGEQVDSENIGGHFGNWDPSYDLALGNEFSTDSTTTDRDWLGSYHTVAVYCRALSLSEVESNYKAGHDALRTDGDPYGHGTHVAGIAGGDGSLSGGEYAGVAPGAGIHSVRVLDADGRGYMSDVIAGLDWVLRHAGEHNIRVVNMSMGKAVLESAATDPLVMAVEQVWDAGLVVVASAGNYGRDGVMTVTSPGISPKIITVGSLTDRGTGDDFSDDFVSTYSSTGPTLIDHYLKPDLLAPGNRLVAAMPAMARMRADLPDRVPACGPACSPQYLELSGTSMAAGMVSGAVAVMLSQDPQLSPSSVKARLMRSARKIDGDATATGAGVLDVEAALADTGLVAGDALSPRMARSQEGPVILVEDTAKLWGDTAWAAGYIWTDGYMWTDSYLVADGYVWTDGYIWTDGYVWTDGYIWTDGYLWTDSFIWTDSYVWTDAVQDLQPLRGASAQSGYLDDD